MFINATCIISNSADNIHNNDTVISNNNNNNNSYHVSDNPKTANAEEGKELCNDINNHILEEKEEEDQN